MQFSLLALQTVLLKGHHRAPDDKAQLDGQPTPQTSDNVCQTEQTEWVCPNRGV
jgi:hypothetical protein